MSVSLHALVLLLASRPNKSDVRKGTQKSNSFDRIHNMIIVLKIEARNMNAAVNIHSVNMPGNVPNL